MFTFLFCIDSLVLILIVAFQAAGAERLKTAAGKVIDWAVGLVWSPLSSRWGLRKYRKILRQRSTDIHLPFLPNRTLDLRNIFVPLRLMSGAEGDGTTTASTDAIEIVGRYKRLVILGVPGSGKSTLLRRLLLAYAEDREEGLPAGVIPVLLELHAFNNPELTIEQRIADVLVAHGFAHDAAIIAPYVQTSLQRGRFALLLDGLDEVNTTERARVVELIEYALDRYEQCRAIVTCRTAVYHGEAQAAVDHTCEIDDFSDQQIRIFLRSWREQLEAAGKSVEQLVQTLRDRPRLFSLARNPLMLTLIATLYTDAAFELPRSRADFYQRAVNQLLDQWQAKRNRYEARIKQSVLKHLALFNQNQGTHGEQDRRSISFETVVAELRGIASRLNIDPDKDVEPLLDEIVERSGLLLAIDGKQRYQFAHLTMQEFFAASYLVGDPQGLVSRFRTDPEAWRETVKLWCGLAEESTEVLKEIAQVAPIVALECLADVKQVDNAFAATLIRDFARQLHTPDVSDAVLRAFGEIAADRRPRGERVLEALRRRAMNTQSETQRIHLIRTLIYSNRPEAVTTVIYFFPNAVIRPLIAQLGDLAVSALKTLAGQDEIEAIPLLGQIGTPQAALALLSLMWHSSALIRSAAAWELAALLPNAEIEETLRTVTPSSQEAQQPRIRWIWEPFLQSGETLDSSLPLIAGQVAHLVTHDFRERLPEQENLPIDPRLAVPLLVIADSKEQERRRNVISKYPRRTRKTVPVETGDEFGEEITPEVNRFCDYVFDKAPERQIFLALPQFIRNRIFSFLNAHLAATPQQWARIFIPSKYVFEYSIHFRFITAIYWIATLLTIIFTIIYITQSTTFSLPIIAIISFVSISALSMCILRIFVSIKTDNAAPNHNYVMAFIIPLVYFPKSIIQDLREGKLNFRNRISFIFLLVFLLLVVGETIFIIYSLFLLRMFFNFSIVFFIILLFAGIISLLARRGLQLAKAADNPLHESISTIYDLPRRRKDRGFKMLWWRR